MSRADKEEEENIFKEIKATARPLKEVSEFNTVDEATNMRKRDEKIMDKGCASPSKLGHNDKALKEKVA